MGYYMFLYILFAIVFLTIVPLLVDYFDDGWQVAAAIILYPIVVAFFITKLSLYLFRGAHRMIKKMSVDLID